MFVTGRTLLNYRFALLICNVLLAYQPSRPSDSTVCWHPPENDFAHSGNRLGMEILVAPQFEIRRH